ncbi:sigma-70 family RNA polymerase sigma factor [Sphingobacterium sp. lm-10]|uniref:RNA polymerase sigma factor n=1 Tax=Sphingobacterium sp. lm-10 TaxID=2944904 RepID=UPI002021A8FE|nr:sigma-70 family RNA polymerase sigma factor [Sphingobacterium sp. lm-10]MCL7988325.1 sigma-70 family RNA polymerase sigma factor [Sphingobacterium sp. lm-10]
MKLTNIDMVWEGCKKQDRKAQAALYHHFSSKMFSVCLRYAKDHLEAEDILQNGFVKVYTKHHLYDGTGSLEGWIRRIMVNTAIEVYRKRKIVYMDLQEEGNGASHIVSTFQADQTGYKDLLQLINQLPVNYKTIFNLYAIEGFSHKEIADNLSITETNSKSQLSRARSWLKERLTKMDNIS